MVGSGGKLRTSLVKWMRIQVEILIESFMGVSN
jgi:hypothetical protein